MTPGSPLSAEVGALRDLLSEIRRLIQPRASATHREADGDIEALLQAAEDICRRLDHNDAALAERLSKLERSLSDLTHDLTNAFTVVVGVADRLQHERRIPRAHRDKLHLVAEQGRRGAGLVRQIGELKARLRPDSGEPPPAATAASAVTTNRNGRIVLLVEDQEAVRLVVSWQIEGLGFQVLAAAGLEDALVALQQRPDDIALAVLDWVIPGTDGPAMLAHVRTVRPRLPIIVLTAQPLDASGQATLRRHAGVQWLQKPASVEQLRAAVRQAQAQPGSAATQPPPKP